MTIESQSWRKYERRIHEGLGEVYNDCDLVFDDRIFARQTLKRRNAIGDTIYDDHISSYLRDTIAYHHPSSQAK